MAEPLDEEELREDVSLVIRVMVRGGFRSREDIWNAATDICDEAEDPDPLLQFAAAELEAAWEGQRAEEAEWPERTDSDRLDQAFAELESLGILCRQDFTCCGTCGAAEIGGEFVEAEERGARPRGYAFFHQQDTEHAVDGDGLYLNYGAKDGSEDAALVVGREIVAVITSHGLAASWNGQWAQRIFVPMTWRRRRFACGPAV